MEDSNHVEGRGASAGETPANEFYYFRVGLGDWRGAFHFRFTGQRKFWADSLGLKNRFLALSMAAVSALFGKARILSHVEGSLTDGKAGVAWNSVRIVKFGITLYLLRERYVLNSDGRNVRVVSDERFGPIPFLFRTAKEHPAEILDGGMSAIYHIPLLGTEWIAEYTVHPDRDHIDAVMRCPWGEASEVIDRVSEQPPIEDSASTPAQRLNALAGRIEGYRRKYEARRDDRAIFAFVYGGITRNLAAELEQSPSQFDDPDWVVELDLRFAEYFFEAMDAIDAAVTDSADAERRLGGLRRFKPWVDTYRAIREHRSTVLEALVFSMASHIGLDLPQALADVKMEREGRSCLADYQKMNGLLGEQIDFIQRSTGDRYNRALKCLDKWAGRYDELFTNYGIRAARAIAWYNAQRLLNESTKDEARRSIEKSTDTLIELVRRPKSRVVRVLLWSGRAAVRLFRKWPKPLEASPSA